MREIAANPPIEQTGNIIRIGNHHENYHNISIDYDIEAPGDAFLEANSGSGDITDEGVGANAKINTGSGTIHASGLQGGFRVETGSGDIYAEQTGEGDVRAQTGSGSIELKEIHGGAACRHRLGRHQDQRHRPPATGSSIQDPEASSSGPETQDLSLMPRQVPARSTPIMK